MAPAVELERVTIRRGGRDVVRDVSASFGQGSVTGLFGPSGSGKSTIMRAIAGVQAEVHGRITVFGAAPGDASVRATLGYMTQAPSVYDDLTVEENMRYFAAIRGAGLREEIDRVGLSDHRGQLVRNLSGGQHSRASLAAALIGRPRLLLLDEPTVGLDPLLRRQLWALFRQFADDGAALFVSSHVLDEARHCDQLILLRDGVLVAQLTPAALVERTGTDDLDEAFVRLIEEQQP